MSARGHHRMPLPVRRPELVSAAIFTAGAAAILAGLPSERGAVLASNVGQCLAPGLAALGCFELARRLSDRAQQRGWRFLGAAAMSWALGQVVWTYYEITGRGAPFPSLADAGYLLALPLAAAGVWSMGARSLRSTRGVAMVDGLIIAVGLLSVSWTLVLGPSWRAGSDSTFALVLSLAYPVGNLVVATSVLTAVMRVGRRAAGPLVMVAAGLLLLTGADSWFVIASLNGNEQAVSVSDIGWMAGYLLIFLASRRQPATGDAGEEPRAPSLRQALVPFAVVLAALVIRLSLVAVGAPKDNVVGVLSVVVVLLMLARNLMTILENRDLTASLEAKIGELTAREDELRHQAFHDPLTGLANRLLFGDRVAHALRLGARDRHRTAVLFVDLDDFKTVNDSLGHLAGDRLLAAVASRLGGCVRPGDTVARLGGDEFGILLEQVDGPEHASAVAARVIESLEMPFPVGAREVSAHASVGVAMDDGSVDGEQLLSNADVALYAAKAAGKHTYRGFEMAMRSAAVERMELGQDLRRAVERRQIRCDYQPIVDLVTGRAVALEALARWDHPERGPLPPGLFIGLAEEIGAIAEIGRCVLELACRDTQAWRASGVLADDVSLHVNLSGRQLQDPGLAAEVRHVLAATGLPPRVLVLEVTESVAVQIESTHLGGLVELRAIGVRVAIDDFGTGYSSLNYLRALPVDVLKIDRAFTQTDDITDPVLLEAIVRLGRSLGIETIAEGVERSAQAATLRRLGCRRAQGFLFSLPVRAAALPDAVARLDAGSRASTPPEPAPGPALH